MNNLFIVKPYRVGKDRKSLAMILPADVVKLLKINPLAIFLLLTIRGSNEIQLRIIRQEKLEIINENNVKSVDQSFAAVDQQTTPIGGNL